jgi:hypothetical protein
MPIKVPKDVKQKIRRLKLRSVEAKNDKIRVV